MATDWLAADVWVTIKQDDSKHAPKPYPLDNGFQEGTRYRVYERDDYGQGADAFFLLVNDRGEWWSIATRHTREVLR